ncbi:MAG: WecB/TagA/CpsF family glycosyltransferase, partial [Pseudomonadota bacterium]
MTAFELSVGAGAAPVCVNTPSKAALLDEIASRLSAGRGFALATVNLDHLVKLRASAAFRAAYADHDLIVADGNPIVWLSRLAGRPVELAPGADLVAPLMRLAAEADAPVAFVGSTSEALEAAAARLSAEVPGLRIAALIAPPYGGRAHRRKTIPKAQKRFPGGRGKCGGGGGGGG